MCTWVRPRGEERLGTLNRVFSPHCATWKPWHLPGLQMHHLNSKSSRSSPIFTHYIMYVWHTLCKTLFQCVNTVNRNTDLSHALFMTWIRGVKQEIFPTLHLLRLAICSQAASTVCCRRWTELTFITLKGSAFYSYITNQIEQKKKHILRL